jgi:pimeloyl-ACP methyl ester carboxylesterase
VVLVHGLAGSAVNWTDFAGQLRSRLDVEIIDLAGHGRSGPAPGRDYSMRAHVRTVIAYLEQSGRAPVHLVGNSMGGVITLSVAAQRPDLVRTLTVISPAVPDVRLRIHPLRYNPRVGLLVVPGVGTVALRKFAKVPVEERVRQTVRLCFADPVRLPEQRFDELVDEARARLSMPWADEAVLRSTRGLVRTQYLQRRSVWSAIRTVRVPTLVLWGEGDRLVASDLAGFVAAGVPDSRQLVLEGVGHTAMLEVPQLSARAFFGLLEDSGMLASA